MNGFTLKQLEYFVNTAQTGSLSTAARNCHVSHAAISNGLNELERSLGVQLLIRKRAKGATATAAGRALLVVARRMLKDAAEVESMGHAQPGMLEGTLSIACNLALSPVLIPLIASHFAREYPKVELSFHEGTGDEVLRLVRDGQIDVGLAFERQVTDDMEYLPVCPARTKAVLPADHPLAGRESINLAELADERAILAASGPSHQATQRVMLEAGIVPQVRWTFASPETIRAMVARGFGYSLLSVRPSEQGLDNASIVYVPISDQVSENNLVLVLPPRRRHVAQISLLEDILRSDEVTHAIG